MRVRGEECDISVRIALFCGSARYDDGGDYREHNQNRDDRAARLHALSAIAYRLQDDYHKAYNCGDGRLFERLIQQVSQTIATQRNLSFLYLSRGRFVVPGQQDWLRRIQVLKVGSTTGASGGLAHSDRAAIIVAWRAEPVSRSMMMTNRPLRALSSGSMISAGRCNSAPETR